MFRESAAGKTFTFLKRPVRYVRDYLNGSTANEYDPWVEMEVWGGLGGYQNLAAGLRPTSDIQLIYPDAVTDADIHAESDFPRLKEALIEM